MHNWAGTFYFLRDNFLFVAFGLVIVLLVVAWLVFEAFRGMSRRSEVDRLRSRLYQLERGQSPSLTLSGGAAVLANRWVNVGSAATTSDGGCLVLLEGASPLQKRAVMTIRVDGLPARRNQSLVVGQRVEVEGKLGTYSIELFGVAQNIAQVGIALRSRHEVVAGES